jgi:hypothetical protein
VGSVLPSWLNWSEICAITIHTSSGEFPQNNISSIYVQNEQGGRLAYASGSWTYQFGASASTPISPGDVLTLALTASARGDMVEFDFGSPFAGSDPIMA